jgi:predicted transcriptional regulator
MLKKQHGGQVVGENTASGLSRRERQIMDVIYRLGEASVAEVREEIPDAPTYSAVRALMGILKDKGELIHERQGPRYIYRPTTPRSEARMSALEKVLSTFFDDSPTEAMAALIDLSDDLSDAELGRLEDLIRDARREGR